MQNKIQVELCLQGHDQNCAQTMSRVISEKLLLNKIEFHERMARVSQQYDDRAAVLMDTFEVTDLNLTEKSGVANIGYDWNAYHDFEDISRANKVQDNWLFTIADNKAKFELELPEQYLVHEI